MHIIYISIYNNTYIHVYSNTEAIGLYYIIVCLHSDIVITIIAVFSLNILFCVQLPSAISCNKHKV